MPGPAISARQRRAFGLVAGACLFFVAATLVAMAVYPGGSVRNPRSTGYSFFDNFFSDLGQTRTLSGAGNAISLTLFAAALTVVAFGLALFFVALADLYSRRRARPWGRVAAVFGTVTGACFVGVAATPWNLLLNAHNEFVMWAFRSFLAAAVTSCAALILETRFPRRFAAIFGAFAVLLLGYVFLLAFGPKPSTPEGARVQAVGQKVIAYASVLAVLAEAVGLRRLAVSASGDVESGIHARV